MLPGARNVRAFMTPDEASITAPAGPALTDGEKKALSNFVKLADGMAAALSADDLTAFNKASAPAMEITAALTDALKDRAGLAPALTKLEAARHFHGLPDLKAARKAFHAFTLAATAALEPLRRAGGAPDFQIWECTMVDQAVEGAPKKGRWLQAGGRPGHNPFFGKEMLECAEEIKR